MLVSQPEYAAIGGGGGADRNSLLRLALVQLFNTSNKDETERIERYARPLGASIIGLGVIVLSMGEFLFGL